VGFLEGDERRMVAGLRRGDPGAWAGLCDEYGNALYRFISYRTGGDAHLAEDIRQETFLAAADGIRSFRGESTLFGWLCAIARRKIADELRRCGRLTSLPDGEASEQAGGWTQLGVERLPEEWLQQAQRRSAVVEALWSLPQDYRQALLLRYADGEDVDTIARKIGRSYKAAESLLARARSALREKLVEVDHG
jgi:RNA polymerase sigma-70 factor (ECF subfamily)